MVRNELCQYAGTALGLWLSGSNCVECIDRRRLHLLLQEKTILVNGNAPEAHSGAFCIGTFVYQPIADTDLGQNVVRLCRRFLYFPPERSHQGPKRLGVVAVSGTVNLVDDILSCQYLSDIFEKQRQKIVLHRGDMELFSVQTDLMPLQING